MSEHIRVLIEEKEVDRRIRELGDEISKAYQGEQIVLVAVLKGAVFFATELAKRITVPVIIDFMSTSSYGSGTQSTGRVEIKKEISVDPHGKHIVIVEDIIDSGHTLAFLDNYFANRGAKSVRKCTLLDKPERRETEVEVQYVGFTIPNEFVVGYGLDYDQKYRNLPYIGVIEFD